VDGGGRKQTADLVGREVGKMAAPEAELEQRFTEMLTSRAATARRGATGALDPHPVSASGQDGRSPPSVIDET